MFVRSFPLLRRLGCVLLFAFLPSVGVAAPDHRRALAWGLDWTARQVTEEGALREAPKGTGVGRSSLALLVFLEQGQTPRVGVYKDAVARLVEGIQTDEDGRTRDGSVESQILATWAMAQLTSLTRNMEHRQRVRPLLDGLLAMQGEDGGFGPEKTGSRIRETALAAVALRAARRAGYPLLEEVGRIRAFLDARLKPTGDVETGEGEGEHVARAATALGLIICGSRADGAPQRAMERADPARMKTPGDIWWLLYAAFQFPGDRFERLARTRLDLLLEHQVAVPGADRGRIGDEEPVSDTLWTLLSLGLEVRLERAVGARYEPPISTLEGLEALKGVEAKSRRVLARALADVTLPRWESGAETAMKRLGENRLLAEKAVCELLTASPERVDFRLRLHARDAHRILHERIDRSLDGGREPAGLPEKVVNEVTIPAMRALIRHLPPYPFLRHAIDMLSPHLGHRGDIGSRDRWEEREKLLEVYGP